MGAYSNSIRQITQKGNTWSADQVFDANIRFNDDKKIKFGSDSDITQYFESSSSKLIMEDNSNQLFQMSDSSGFKLDSIQIQDQTIRHAWIRTKLSDWAMYSDPGGGSGLQNADGTSLNEAYWLVDAYDTTPRPILALKESISLDLFGGFFSKVRVHVVAEAVTFAQTLYLRYSVGDGGSWNAASQQSIGTTREYNLMGSPSSSYVDLDGNTCFRLAFEWAGVSSFNLKLYAAWIELVE